jgi:hypothetical protein
MSGKSQNYKHQSVRLEIVSLREPEFWGVWILSPKKEDDENQ